MCEFCHQHGEGKTWYLQARNYAEDLLSDVNRRGLMKGYLTRGRVLKDGVDRLGRIPAFVRRAVRPFVARRMKPHHYGQVVPIEEIERILGFVNSIVRIACLCRRATLGSDKRYCYALSLGPGGGEVAKIIEEADPSFFGGPHVGGMELLTRDDALRAHREHEREGLCHTVWTFQAPYIGGICNCDEAGCLAMTSTVTHKVPLFFKAEFIARADRDLCNGCAKCLRICPFAAVAYDKKDRKAEFLFRRCYGCGICRSACERGAIALIPRSDEPAARRLW
jgi:Pyruvate/2-oxoacid:ferredoxin oxidoreductase delta subunit